PNIFLSSLNLSALSGLVKISAYKLYNPNSNKVVISRDVVVDEKSQWNWNSELNK
ncbi:hypothetical protein A2U01_0085767, partial [Trifolium medium]|nr:hypothetical protein [Trifolium medium]